MIGLPISYQLWRSPLMTLYMFLVTNYLVVFGLFSFCFLFGCWLCVKTKMVLIGKAKVHPPKANNECKTNTMFCTLLTINYLAVSYIFKPTVILNQLHIPVVLVLGMPTLHKLLGMQLPYYIPRRGGMALYQPRG